MECLLKIVIKVDFALLMKLCYLKVIIIYFLLNIAKIS